MREYLRKQMELTKGELSKHSEKLEDLSSQMAKKANKNGRYPNLTSGFSMGFEPTGKNAGVTYAEKLPASRSLIGTQDMGGNSSLDKNTDYNVKITDVRGDVMGGNQMVSYIQGSLISNNDIDISVEGSTVIINVKRNLTYSRTVTLGAIKRLANHIILQRADADFDISKVTYGSWMYILVPGGWTYPNIIHKLTSPSEGDWGLSINSSIPVGVYHFTWNVLDLTTLFPTDTTFVNNLDTNDVPKVLHRLGFFVADELNGSVTENNDLTLQLGTEGIAKMGYVEPKLTFGSCGILGLVDSTKMCDTRNGVAPTIKKLVDMRADKTAAWNKALEVLREKSIAIPAFAEKPIEFSIDEQVGVKWTKEGLYINAWMVDLATLSWGKYTNTTTNKSLFYAALSSAKLGNFVALKFHFGMSVNSLSGNYVDGEAIFSPGSQMLLRVYLEEFSNKTSAEFNTAMQGQYLIYGLAEPIFIPFDEEVDLSFLNANGKDILVQYDMDGNPLYDLKIETLEDGTIRRSLSPNFAWVEAHQELPVALNTTMSGLGFAANYDTMLEMWNWYQSQKNL